LPASTETIADSAPTPVFANEDTGDAPVEDEWDAEPSGAAPAAAAAAKPKPAAAPAGPKKTPKQIAKEREMLEAAERAQAAAARERAARAEMEKMRADPEYARQKKEQEKRDIEQSERNLASDLFGDAATAPRAAKPADAELSGREAEKAARAKELANASGLGDGADNMSLINDPNAKRVTGQAPPSVMDQVSLATKEDAAAFAKLVARKLQDGGNSAVMLALLKEVTLAVGPVMKLEDVTELVRVGTVIKNDTTKAQQNKKKKSAKPQLKSTGKSSSGAYDDYDDYDGGDRNGPDADFYN